MRKYVIALYIRLSLEDSKTESMSIPNQRTLLREHAKRLPEWDDAEVLEFVDNGHSGANFERPAVQKLLELVQKDKIDCIIVKDLSRFGRNSIETGYFIERVFPLYHTRFISVSDDFDTNNFKGDTGGIDVAFKYLISECYSRDMSVKTKTAKYAKMRRGEYQSKICPYGYKKSTDGRMEIDEDAAAVVRQIFGWYADGVSAAEIFRRLYSQSIPTPGEYKASKGEKMHDTSRTHGIWHSSTILRIIDDERYIGTYVIGKRVVKEIGGTRVRLKDESEWIKIPDHHPAIISQELFERAKAAGYRFSLPNKKTREYPLRGKVYCGCCDHAMSRTAAPATYYCRHSQIDTSFPCHGLHIRAAELETLVFQIVQAQLNPVLGVDVMNKESLDLQLIQQSEHEKKLRAIQDDKRRLYEQYTLGEIGLEAYKAKKAAYDAELVRIKNVHATIAAQAKRGQQEYEAMVERQEVIREAAGAGTLTKAMNALISKVYVFPGDRIEIEYAVQDFLLLDNARPEAADGDYNLYSQIK